MTTVDEPSYASHVDSEYVSEEYTIRSVEYVSQECRCCGCSCKINITLLTLGGLITFLQSLSAGIQLSPNVGYIVQYITIALSALIVTFQSVQLALSKVKTGGV